MQNGLLRWPRDVTGRAFSDLVGRTSATARVLCPAVRGRPGRCRAITGSRGSIAGSIAGPTPPMAGPQWLARRCLMDPRCRMPLPNRVFCRTRSKTFMPAIIPEDHAGQRAADRYRPVPSTGTSTSPDTHPASARPITIFYMTGTNRALERSEFRLEGYAKIVNDRLAG